MKLFWIAFKTLPYLKLFQNQESELFNFSTMEVWKTNTSSFQLEFKEQIQLDENHDFYNGEFLSFDMGYDNNVIKS